LDIIFLGTNGWYDDDTGNRYTSIQQRTDAIASVTDFKGIIAGQDGLVLEI
jgi:hypothetical protein